MGFLKSLNQLIALFIDSLKLLGRGRIWSALLVYFILNLILLYAHYDIFCPLVYSAMSAWTKLINEAGAMVFTHYPGHFLMMPEYFHKARMALALVFEGLVLGVVAIQFRNALLAARGRDRLGVKSAVKSWISLLSAWLTINALTIGVSMFVPDWLAFFHDDSPRRLMAVEFVIIPFLLTLVLALFFFAIPAIVVYRENFFRGIGRSLGIFVRRPMTSFCLSGLILSGPFLVSAASSRSPWIVSNLHPEMVLWVLLAGLVVEMIANFFWMGTAVRFLIEDEME